MLGNTSGAVCGNTVETKKHSKNPAPFPPSPKGKKLVTFGCMLVHFIGSQEILHLYVATTWKKEKIVHS
jgi:hypothetical protein